MSTPVESGLTWGPDLGHYQWDAGPVDFRLLKQAGASFVIPASGDDTYLDPTFERTIDGSLAAGLKVKPFYHYLRLGRDIDPESRADLLVRRRDLAVSLGAVGAFPVADWEDTSAKCQAMSVLQRQEWASEFLSSLEDNCGCQDFGCYTGTWWFGWWMGKIDPMTRLWGQFFHHRLWLGQYIFGTDPTGFTPLLPTGWSNWSALQFSSSGSVPGVVGNVDLNVARPEFFGQKEDDMTPEEVRAIVEQVLGEHLPVAVTFDGDPHAYWVNVLTQIDSPDYLQKVKVLNFPADHPLRRVAVLKADGLG